MDKIKPNSKRKKTGKKPNINKAHSFGQPIRKRERVTELDS